MTTRVPLPAYADGDQDKQYTAFLDFGGRLCGTYSGPPTPALEDGEVLRMFHRVVEYLRPLNIAVTTVEPVKRPGEYVTIRFLHTGLVQWRNSGGHCPRKAIFNTNWWVPNVVYVGQTTTWEDTAAVAAHEFVHCVQPDGISHEDTPVNGHRNLMRGSTGFTGGKLSENMTRLCRAQIAEMRKGQRLGAYVRENGLWTFGWHNIGP